MAEEPKEYIFKAISPDDFKVKEFKVKVLERRNLPRQRLIRGKTDTFSDFVIKELAEFITTIFSPFVWFWRLEAWKKLISAAAGAILICVIIFGYVIWRHESLPKSISEDYVYGKYAKPNLFDSDGKSLYYYDGDEDGLCAFWDNPGISEITSHKLLPLTEDVLDMCKEKARKEKERKAEEERLAKEKAHQEEARLAEKKRLEEEKRQAEEKVQEEKRLAEEKAKLEAEKKKKEEEFKKYYDLGQKAFIESKLYQEAVDNYSQALAINPDDVNALIGRCAAFVGVKKHDEAMQDCNKALVINPNETTALGNVCSILWYKEKYVEVLQCNDKLVAIYQKYGSRHQDKIEEIEKFKKQIKQKIAEKETEEKKREEAAKKATEKERQRLEAEQRRIEKEKREAEEKERKRIEAEQRRIEKERRKAEEARKRAEARAREAERRKYQTGACNSKGYDFYNAGNYEEAIKWFDNALAWNPKNVYALFNRCLALQMLKRYDEALSYCDQALSVNSDCVHMGGSEDDCFNREKIAAARKDVEAKKVRSGKKANVVPDYSYAYGVNWFWFILCETNGINVSFTSFRVRIWNMSSDNESPQLFKQRVPTEFTGQLSFGMKGNECYYDYERTRQFGRKNEKLSAKFSVDSYQEWLYRDEWVEVVFIGQDENGNYIEVVLEGVD